MIDKFPVRERFQDRKICNIVIVTDINRFTGPVKP